MVRKLCLLVLIVMLLHPAIGNQPFTLSAKRGETQIQPPAYVEPGLASGTVGDLSVIISAGSSQQAAQAVKQVGGMVTSDLWLIEAVGAVVPANRIEELAALPGVRTIVNNKVVAATGRSGPRAVPAPLPTSTTTTRTATSSDDGWVTSYRFPVPWDGTPDVQPTSSWIKVKLAYPMKIDVGADQVLYRGVNIGVAIVDSGIYFDEQVKSQLGQFMTSFFIGQADFIDPVCGIYTVHQRTYSTGEQNPDHCFTSSNTSIDPYGHGTHVAGIIWNNITEDSLGFSVGVAPAAKILGVRVLDADGSGTYEQVIQGIQYVVANQTKFNIRVLNLSLSARPTTPYFVDPLNRAVEQAWAAGIVVVAAAGNDGPGAETISVPGNDPYVITVGAVDGRRTAGYWKDDILPPWSSSGPTLDGFIKPDVLAPGTQIVSFMYNDSKNVQNSSYLVQVHPDYSLTSSLFRMNGTSMATAVTSGVVALILQAHPELAPDEVKYRLMYTARQMTTGEGQLGMSLFQQGAGRIWAPDAVNADIPAGKANQGMNIQDDLAYGWGALDVDGQPVLDWAQLAHHYLGPVRKALSDDGGTILYYVENPDGTQVALGVADAATNQWLLETQVAENTTWSVGKLVWSGGKLVWSGGKLVWSDMGELFDGSGKLIWSGDNLVCSQEGLFDASGKLVWSGGDLFDASGKMVWSGGKLVWSGADLTWSGGSLEWSQPGELFDGSGKMVWSGGKMVWSGGELLDSSGKLVWSGGDLFDASGKLVWSGGKLVWSGSNPVWSGGKMVWSGGKMVWSGGKLVWSGGSSFDPSSYTLWNNGPGLAWSSGKMVWSGGKMVWSGANMNWSSDYPVWSSGKMVWSGGKMVWSGNFGWTIPFNLGGSCLTATRWVDW